ncbi:MAG: hypothetical protein J1F63_06050 [Oscillospiraceae bacterium]|nr:hypothetical protein [Oscillospiraceae bacterium]
MDKKKKLLIIVAVIIVVAAILAVVAMRTKQEPENEKIELPVNEFAYENRPNSELIPGGVVENGDVVESGVGDGLPTEEELGEYQEIFLEGDYLDDGGVGGWVLAISLKDITLNTYNEITTYVLGEKAKAAADHIKPGDAALVYYSVDPGGQKVAYSVGRVRVEDAPLTHEEIAEMYKNAQE